MHMLMLLNQDMHSTLYSQTTTIKVGIKMVKLQPTFLIDKYNNSLDKWILVIPVFDNGVLKLRCCMSRKQQGVFTDIYTYNIDKCRNVLLDFLTEQSYGQAYHKFIRLLKDRDDFIVESDHEKGFSGEVRLCAEYVSSRGYPDPLFGRSPGNLSFPV